MDMTPQQLAKAAYLLGIASVKENGMDSVTFMHAILSVRSVAQGDMTFQSPGEVAAMARQCGDDEVADSGVRAEREAARLIVAALESGPDGQPLADRSAVEEFWADLERAVRGEQ